MSHRRFYRPRGPGKALGQSWLREAISHQVSQTPVIHQSSFLSPFSLPQQFIQRKGVRKGVRIYLLFPEFQISIGASFYQNTVVNIRCIMSFNSGKARKIGSLESVCGTIWPFKNMLHLCCNIRFHSPGGSVVKNLPANAGDTGGGIWCLGQEDPLEEDMATHSSIIAWEISWTEEPDGLQSMGAQRVRHDWATEYSSDPWQIIKERTNAKLSAYLSSLQYYLNIRSP